MKMKSLAFVQKKKMAIQLFVVGYKSCKKEKLNKPNSGQFKSDNSYKKLKNLELRTHLVLN